MPINMLNQRFKALFDNNVVLYGAGITGLETCKALTSHFRGVKIIGFCDTYKTGMLGGLRILRPDELQKIAVGGGAIVIVTALADNQQGIIQQLDYLGIPEHLIFTLAEIDELVAAHPDDGSVGGWYRSIKLGKTELARRIGNNTYLNWWCPEHFCANDVLVYQCGKVGSSTVCNSLTAAGVGATHVHMLTDRFIFDLLPELAWHPTPSQSEIIAKSSAICVDRIKNEDRLKIITLVREPLSRDFSAFVYHLRELEKAGYLSLDGSLVEFCADGIQRRATQNGTSVHGYQFDWFNDELKAVFGIDVYAHPFDRDLGYTIIRQDQVELMVVKLEKLGYLESAIGAFVGTTNFRLDNSNQSSKKDYYNIYKDLREKVRLAPEIIALYYDRNPYMNHFYSYKEQEVFLKAWEANLLTPFVRREASSALDEGGR